MQTTLPSWPYPRWVAHRGAGHLAPENTLAAIRHGAALGHRMFECDVKLSADGVLLLLHDDTLDRTTSGHGPAALHTWSALSQLDAGSWHSPAYAGEPLAHLAAVIRFCATNAVLANFEIKPSPGEDAATANALVLALQRLWPAAMPRPLLSSFSTVALQAVATADSAGSWPRGLLLDVWRDDAAQVALDLGCCALIAHHPLWQAERVAQARHAQLRCAAYTVNEPTDAERLLHLGLDTLITDAVDGSYR